MSGHKFPEYVFKGIDMFTVLDVLFYYVDMNRKDRVRLVVPRSLRSELNASGLSCHLRHMGNFSDPGYCKTSNVFEKIKLIKSMHLFTFLPRCLLSLGNFTTQ